MDAEPIGTTLDCIHGILDPWLGVPRYATRDHSFRLTYRFVSDAGTPLKLKVEINTRWFTGAADITTFALPELLGTKLRASLSRR